MSHLPAGRSARWPLMGLLLATVLGCDSAGAASARSVNPPAFDPPAAMAVDTAYFAGGCFWGVQAVFQHVVGVQRATSGYSGGETTRPTYQQVTTGRTGHAETVRVIYDPAKVSFGTLLQVYFTVAHDPTQLDRQGPDIGTHYRSAIFVRTIEQEQVARSYIAQLEREAAFPSPIVTRITPFTRFHEAEAYHQDYVTLHPDEPYVRVHDAPKLVDLERRFPALWTARKAPA